MGSSNTENIGVRYCRKCRANRKFYKIKPRISGKGYSYGHPTQYVCSRAHAYDAYPPKKK